MEIRQCIWHKSFQINFLHENTNLLLTIFVVQVKQLFEYVYANNNFRIKSPLTYIFGMLVHF